MKRRIEKKRKKKKFVAIVRFEDLFSAEWTAFAEITPICMKTGVEIVRFMNIGHLGIVGVRRFVMFAQI